MARSQEAEYFFNSYSKNASDVAISAGTKAHIGESISQAAVRVMTEINIDMSSAISEQLDRKSIEGIDMVVTFKDKEELPSYLQSYTPIQYWHVPNPRGQGLDFHRKVRDDIEKHVKRLLAEIES